jgi:hypothetical protein
MIFYTWSGEKDAVLSLVYGLPISEGTDQSGNREFDASSFRVLLSIPFKNTLKYQEASQEEYLPQ